MSSWTALVVWALLGLHGIAIIYLWNGRFTLTAVAAAFLMVAGTAATASASVDQSFFQAVDKQILRGWCIQI